MFWESAICGSVLSPWGTSQPELVKIGYPCCDTDFTEGAGIHSLLSPKYMDIGGHVSD